MQEVQQNQTPDETSRTAEQAAAASGEQTTAPPEDMTSLEQALRKAEAQAQEHHDAWLRARAEADNIRKRAQVEVANAHKFGVENFAAALLPVKDSLEAALAAQNDTVESIRDGVQLTLKQLSAAFEKFGLVEINPVGEKFDPHRHQAMTMVESDAAPNTVIQVLQKGYAIHERIVRPALVSVARGRDG